MTWLLILGLIVCCVVLMSQVSDLTARLGRVEQRLTALAGAPASEPGRAAVAPNAAGTSARAAAVPREPPSLILDWKPRVAGPRIFDSLAVGFLAPALLLGAATLRTVAIRRELLAIYAGGAGLFALVWQLMETRRLFQGASLYAGLDVVGPAEACAYAIIVLVAARAVLGAGEVAAPRAWEA